MTELAGQRLADVDAAGLAAVCEALGSPVRLRLLAVILAAGDAACACELVDRVGLSQSAVAHQLAVLVAGGLLRREQRGTWAWYVLIPDRLKAVRHLLVA